MQTLKKFFIKSFFGLSCLFSSMILAETFDDIDSIMGCVTPIAVPTPPLPGSGCVNAIDILQIITPEFGQSGCSATQGTCPPTNCIVNAPAILQENFYLSTVGPITRRSLLDEPSLRNYVLDDCMFHLTIQPFYNYTPRVVFDKNSPFIRSYLDFANATILNQIDLALEMSGCTNVDIPNILGLFSGLKLQQHRVGIMFGVGTKIGCLNLSFRIPLYYIIEHFFLTDAEIEAIGNAPFLANNPGFSSDLTSKEKGEEFGLKHLVSDRLGFGDMRMNAMFKVYEDNRDHFWFGLQMTIPTARTFKAGLLGANFSPCTNPPPFNIKQLFELFLCAEGDIQQRGANAKIQEITTTFFIGALDRLTTILFNAPLGNGRHVGIGPQLDFVHELTENWSIQTYAAWEGFSRHNEDRFFLDKKTPQEFNRNWRDEANAEANLSFLNQQVINTFFPSHLKIGIRNGYIGKYATALVCESLNWHGFVGFDYWYQGPEKIYVNDQLLAEFDVDKAAREAAHQGKFFFSFGYRNLYRCDKIFFDAEFAGDIGVFSRGIGNSYTLGFRLSLDI